MKNIEQLTDEDLQAIWPAIGGAPHLFSHGKDELRLLLITGHCTEPELPLQMDFYTMAAIVDILRHRGFETASVEHYY